LCNATGDSRKKDTERAAWIGKQLLNHLRLREQFQRITENIIQVQFSLSLEIPIQLFYERQGQQSTNMAINQSDLIHYLDKEKIPVNEDIKQWIKEAEDCHIKEARRNHEELIGIPEKKENKENKEKKMDSKEKSSESKINSQIKTRLSSVYHY